MALINLDNFSFGEMKKKKFCEKFENFAMKIWKLFDLQLDEIHVTYVSLMLKFWYKKN